MTDQMQQPGGEEALVELVAEAIFENDPDAPELDDNCLDPEGVRDSYRAQANAAIAAVRQWDDGNPHDQSALLLHEGVRGILGAPEPKPDVRAQALEEAAAWHDRQAVNQERHAFRANGPAWLNGAVIVADEHIRYAAAIRALIAAPPPVPARECWQPIETAPRDHELLLGWHMDGTVSWATNGVWIDLSSKDGALPGAGYWSCEPRHGRPNVWAPRPAPPAGATP